MGDTHREFNQHIQSAQNWYHNSVLPQADQSLAKIGQPKPQLSKVKVKSGSTPSCIREPVNRQPELTMEAVQQRRDYANFLLQSRKADIAWRHEDAVKKLYLPYVQNKQQSSTTWSISAHARMKKNLPILLTWHSILSYTAKFLFHQSPTRQWLPLWRCSHCSLVPNTVTTEHWLHGTHTLLGINCDGAYV